jgi:hypothetical protein
MKNIWENKIFVEYENFEEYQNLCRIRGFLKSFRFFWCKINEYHSLAKKYFTNLEFDLGGSMQFSKLDIFAFFWDFIVKK